MAGTFFQGDNLDVLRVWLPKESVDLVYLDPPFNKDQDFALPFGADEARPAHKKLGFTDTWTWDDAAIRAYDELTNSRVEEMPEKLPGVIKGLHDFLYPRYRHVMLAYLVNMAIRLVELHRVMKPTASLYLHCDPTASHYLKEILDAIFYLENFRNEIVWKRTGSHNSAHKFGPVHDIILYYARSPETPFYPSALAHSSTYLDKFSKTCDRTGEKFQDVTLTGPDTRDGRSGDKWRHYDPTKKGRHWQPASYVYEKYEAMTGRKLGDIPDLLDRLEKLDEVGLIYWTKKGKGEPRYKFYLSDAIAQGTYAQDIWTDIDVINSQAHERTAAGWPTQKPVALLNRILLASSLETDVILDPFCGCGTTVVACEQSGRKNWIGIDLNEEAIRVLRQERIPKEVPSAEIIEKVEPFDVESARRLAELDPEGYEFQWWVNRKIGGRDVGGRKKKGADRNQDGEIFIEGYDGSGRKRVIISAKQGAPALKHVTELASAVLNPEHKAHMGILVELEAPSDNMRTRAREYGRVNRTLPDGEDPYKIQIISAADLFKPGHGIVLPGRNVTQPQEVKFQMAFAFGQKPVPGPLPLAPKGRPKNAPVAPPAPANVNVPAAPPSSAPALRAATGSDRPPRGQVEIPAGDFRLMPTTKRSRSRARKK